MLSSACVVGPPSFPGRVIEPEVVGLVQSADPDPDDPGSWFVSVAKAELVIDVVDDRDLQADRIGDLLFFGTEPERWFLGAPLGEDGCYEISALKG